MRIPSRMVSRHSFVLAIAVFVIFFGIADCSVVAGEPEKPDPCGSHLSCQTCLQDNDCSWCAVEQECVTPDLNGPNTTCPDVINICDCSPFTTCSDCLNPGYCGWCEDLSICYVAGDRPASCPNFDEQVCDATLVLSVEYAILVTMAVVVASLFLVFAAIMIVKILRRKPGTETDDGKALDTIAGGETDAEDDDSADETDSLLTPTKKPLASSPSIRLDRGSKEPNGHTLI